jgi:PAS domain S-box-containing protein
MALALKEGRILEGVEAIAERPDGARTWFTPYPTLLRNADGRILGAVNMLVDITERKQAEEARGHLAAIVAWSQDMIISTDLNGHIVSWNQGAEQLFGYSAEEAIGQHVQLLAPSERHNEEVIFADKLRKGEGVRDHETVRCRKDGRVFDVSLTVSPIRDTHGNLIGTSRIARDITDQKVRHKQQRWLYELATSVNQTTGLADLFEHALHAICQSLETDRASILLCDDDGIMRFKASRGLSLGYRQAVEGHSPWDKDDPVPHAIVISNIAEASLERTLDAIVRGEGIQALAFIPLTYGKRLIGKFMVYFDRPHAFSEHDLQLAHAIANALAFGIERKRSEEALRESELRKRAILDSALDCIITMDHAGRIVDFNPAAEKVFGLPREAAIGHTVAETIIPPRFREAHWKGMERFLQTGQGQVIGRRIQIEAMRADGTEFPVELSITVVQLQDRAPFFTAYLRDITEQKRAERALHASEERLRSQADTLEELVGERTAALVQSQSRLRALAAELNLAEQRERKRIATELHDHLQQLLVLGKLKLGQGKQLIEKGLSSGDVISRVDSILSDALSYTRTLVAELSPPVLRDNGMSVALKWLGESMDKYDMNVTVTVEGDSDVSLPEDQRLLLLQSVRELLINSWKHAGTGQASVTMACDSGMLRFAVKDCGKGFQLAADDTPPEWSSKFGLFSIRERMAALGGSFNIESAPGAGTTCTLELPLVGSFVAPANSPLSAADPVVNEKVALVPNGTVRVLLVDDHAMVRQGLRNVLTGYPDVEIVAEAGDGEEAIHATEKFRPSVVVMDINMPKVDGIEATRRIKARYPDITVLGLSVNANAENQHAMILAGATSLITKEAAVDQLYSAIQQATHSKNLNV